MAKRERYSLQVTPVDGPTMLNRTKTEWSLGYLFRVLFSDSPLFRVGTTITIDEINDQEQYHPVRFDMEFECIELNEYVEGQAGADGELDWGYFKSVELLTKGR